MKEMGKDSYPNPVHPFVENLDRSCNDVSRKLILIFHNPHRKSLHSPPAVALTLEYFVGVPSKAASSEREEKQVWIHSPKTREYLE